MGSDFSFLLCCPAALPPGDRDQCLHLSLGMPAQACNASAQTLGPGGFHALGSLFWVLCHMFPALPAASTASVPKSA